MGGWKKCNAAKRQRSAGRLRDRDLSRSGRQGELITRKGDDLVGCASYLDADKRVKKRGVQTGIRQFSRAPRRLDHRHAGIIRYGSAARSTKIISVGQAKRCRAGIGCWPVIRLGDRGACSITGWFCSWTAVARRSKRKIAGFVPEESHGRRHLRGDALSNKRLRRRRIAIPLHNYHNQAKTKVGPRRCIWRTYRKAPCDCSLRWRCGSIASTPRPRKSGRDRRRVGEIGAGYGNEKTER